MRSHIVVVVARDRRWQEVAKEDRSIGSVWYLVVSDVCSYACKPAFTYGCLYGSPVRVERCLRDGLQLLAKEDGPEEFLRRIYMPLGAMLPRIQPTTSTVILGLANSEPDRQAPSVQVNGESTGVPRRHHVDSASTYQICKCRLNIDVVGVPE